MRLTSVINLLVMQLNNGKQFVFQIDKCRSALRDSNKPPIISNVQVLLVHFKNVLIAVIVIPSISDR